MAGRLKYLVFGLGMVVLVVGIAISLFIIITAPIRKEEAAAKATAGASAPSLSQTLQQTLGISEEQAAVLAQQLQAAAAKAPADDSGGAALIPALQAALGLTEEQATALATKLQQAVEAQATPVQAPASGGAYDEAKVGDQVDLVIRDASGKVKQQGSSK